MFVLGINAYHGDASAAVLGNGELLAAVEEERFRRVKHWAGFPRDSIRTSLGLAGLEAREVDHFAISRNPRANVWRKAVFALRRRPGAGLVADRLRNRRKVAGMAGEIAQALGLERGRVEARL